MADSQLSTEQHSALANAPHDATSTTDAETSNGGLTGSSNASLEPKPDSGHAVNNPQSVGDGGGNEKASPGNPPEPVRSVTGIRWALMVVAILSSTFLFALDNTVVADVEADIVNTFGEVRKISWLPVAFLVASVSTNSIWGKMYTLFNAKYLYLACLLLFEAGSALCGAAPTMNALIGGRVLAGLGGAGLYIGVMTLLSVNTTEQERPSYIGLTGLTWGMGTVLGPIVGGAFAVSSVGWRFAFYINLFVAGVASPVYIFLIPSHDPRPGVSYKARVSNLDFLGTILMIGASVAGVMAISFGGVIYAWNSGQIIACFVVSGFLFIIFGLQQSFCILTTEENRIFPCQFLKKPILINLFAQISAATTIFFLPIYFVPLYLQFVKGDSAINAGLHLLPFVFALVVAVILNGAFLSKFGYYMPWYLGGGCFAIVGSALMYTVDFNSSDAKVYGYTVLMGIGGGMYSQSSFSVAQSKSEVHEIPVAVGFISLGQVSGATIAIAIANSVFLNRATNGILAVIPSASRAAVQSAVSGASSGFFKSLDPSVKRAVLDAVAHAIAQTYILAIVAGALTIVLSIFLPREKLFLSSVAAA